MYLTVLSSKIPDERKMWAELSGNTLSVYCYLLSKRKNAVGPRQIQRAMGFSSSSTACYHLEKLRNMGVIDKNSMGDYNITRVVKVGVLSAFVFVGGHAVPKHLIYALATSAMVLVFAFIYVNWLSFWLIAALSPGMLSALIFWYEAIVVWRRLRFVKVVGSRE